MKFLGLLLLILCLEAAVTSPLDTTSELADEPLPEEDPSTNSVLEPEIQVEFPYWNDTGVDDVSVFLASAVPNEDGVFLAPGKKQKSCTNHKQCPNKEMCYRLKCVDVCSISCGPNTDCVALNHKAVCSCLPGFNGDPKAGCVGDKEECQEVECNEHGDCADDETCISNKCSNPCKNMCAKNAHCKVIKHIPGCACPEGFGGNPYYECKKLEDVGGQGVGVVTGDGQKDRKEHITRIGKEQKGCKGKIWPPPKAGKKKFEVHTGKRIDWTGAYLDCYKKGHRLASIDTVEEYDELNKLLQGHVSNSRFWIGGMGRGKNVFQWIWVAKDQKVDPKVERWVKNAPHLTVQRKHCLQLVETGKRGYNWYDDYCIHKYYYVCEHY